MGFKFLILINLVVFSKIFGMELCKDGFQERVVIEESEYFEPKLLKEIVSDYIAKKLVESLKFKKSYQKILTSHSLNEYGKALILSSLFRNHSRFLWKFLPYKFEPFGLAFDKESINEDLKEIRMYAKDKLLAFYVSQDSEIIRILDTKSLESLAEFRFDNAIINEICKNFLLVKSDSGVTIINLDTRLIAYKLAYNPAAMDLDSKYIYFGFRNGSVRIFEKNINSESKLKEVLAFQAHSSPIKKLKALSDRVILTSDFAVLIRWEINYNDKTAKTIHYHCNLHAIYFSQDYALLLKRIDDYESFAIFQTLSHLECSNSFSIYPSSKVRASVSSDEKMFFCSQVSHDSDKRYGYLELIKCNGKRIRTIILPKKSDFVSFAFAWNNTFILLSTPEGLITKVSFDTDQSLEGTLKKLEQSIDKASFLGAIKSFLTRS